MEDHAGSADQVVQVSTVLVGQELGLFRVPHQHCGGRGRAVEPVAAFAFASRVGQPDAADRLLVLRGLREMLRGMVRVVAAAQAVDFRTHWVA